MHVETGVSPAPALKSACVGKNAYFVILKECAG